MIALGDLSVLVWPLVACLLLVGILGYLGVHVLARKVIFVDLAMAQIAALGAAAAMLLGYEPGDRATYLLSLTFTLVGAAVFAVTRSRDEKVPHEATIGLVYAVASAAGILLADLSPHGADEMKGLLQGSIVWVTPKQLLPAAAAFAVVGTFQYVFRRKFQLISFDPEAARDQGLNVRLWDFFFYLSFGFVITSSVPIAGVLLVFCFLIAPAVAASLFAEGLRARLLVGWLIGAVVSAVGLLFSYDRPSGPTILCTFGVFLAAISMGKAIMNAQRRLRVASFAAGAAALILSAALLGSHVLADRPREAAEGLHEPASPAPADPLAALRDPQPGARRQAAEALGLQGQREAIPELVRLLFDPDGGVREAAAGALGALRATVSIPELEKSLELPGDGDWTPLAIAGALAELGAHSGVDALLRLAREGDAKKVREAATRRLGLALPLEAGVPETLEAGVETTATWWTAHGASLAFDEGRRAFKVKPASRP